MPRPQSLQSSVDSRCSHPTQPDDFCIQQIQPILYVHIGFRLTIGPLPWKYIIASITWQPLNSTQPIKQITTKVLGKTCSSVYKLLTFHNTSRNYTAQTREHFEKLLKTFLFAEFLWLLSNCNVCRSSVRKSTINLIDEDNDDKYKNILPYTPVVFVILCLPMHVFTKQKWERQKAVSM